MMRIGIGALGITPEQSYQLGLSNNECNREVPGWCSWVPGADFFDACAPLSNSEIDAMIACQTKKLQVLNPVAYQQINTPGASAAVDVALHTPKEVCELNATVNHPTLAAMFGPDTVCMFGGGGAQDGTDDGSGGMGWKQYLLLGGLAVGTLVALNMTGLIGGRR